jgi:hypothetical protein
VGEALVERISALIPTAGVQPTFASGLWVDLRSRFFHRRIENAVARRFQQHPTITSHSARVYLQTAKVRGRGKNANLLRILGDALPFPRRHQADIAQSERSIFSNAALGMRFHTISVELGQSGTRATRSDSRMAHTPASALRAAALCL